MGIKKLLNLTVLRLSKRGSNCPKTDCTDLVVSKSLVSFDTGPFAKYLRPNSISRTLSNYLLRLKLILMPECMEFFEATSKTYLTSCPYCGLAWCSRQMVRADLSH